MAVIFSFLFSSCRVVTAQPIAPDLVITNFQTSSRRAKNLKGRRMHAVRVVCAQQRKIKKDNFLSTHAIDIETETTGELGNENVKITNFCLFIFFIRFSISLVTFPDYYFV
jgi:hypothetical protein